MCSLACHDWNFSCVDFLSYRKRWISLLPCVEFLSGHAWNFSSAMRRISLRPCVELLSCHALNFSPAMRWISLHPCVEFHSFFMLLSAGKFHGWNFKWYKCYNFMRNTFLAHAHHGVTNCRWFGTAGRHVTSHDSSATGESTGRSPANNAFEGAVLCSGTHNDVLISEITLAQVCTPQMRTLWWIP